MRVRGRGRGLPAAPPAFSASRMPLAPASHQPPSTQLGATQMQQSTTNQTAQLPYSRPLQDVVPNTDRVLEMFREVLQEVRRGREESKIMGSDIMKMGQLINKLEENYTLLRDEMKEQSESSFSVETSMYKVQFDQ